jgi:hypothetical protein
MSSEREQRGLKSPYYREVTPSAFFGGVRPEYIEATAVTSRLNAVEKMIHGKDVVEHTEEICLKLTPLQAKLFTLWLLKNLKLYEELFGQITEPSGLKEIPAPKELPISKLDEILANL